MKKGRITITTLHEAAASLYDEACFRTIPHLSLGYGAKGCNDTEADFSETVTFLISAVKEEESPVLVLGTCPRSITSSWIKVAEIVIKSTIVKIVVIPLAVVVKKDWQDPTVNGSVIFVNDSGIFRVDHYGEILASNFVKQFSNETESLNEKLLTH
jgi:hypothetical protein